MDKVTNKIYLPSGAEGGPITILEGQAPAQLPLREPQKIAINGDIRAVRFFLQGRERHPGLDLQEVDERTAIIVADKAARQIHLMMDPQNFYGTTITGTLTESNEIKPFGINTDKKYDRQALAKMIKFARFYFKDKTQHAILLADLHKLRIKTETELNQERDNRGNRRDLTEVSVVDDNAFQRFFKMNIPLFKGYSPQLIEVEICYEVVNNAIVFWLESIGLAEMIEQMVDEIFTAELDQYADFVTIHK